MLDSGESPQQNHLHNVSTLWVSTPAPPSAGRASTLPPYLPSITSTPLMTCQVRIATKMLTRHTGRVSSTPCEGKPRYQDAIFTSTCPLYSKIKQKRNNSLVREQTAVSSRTHDCGSSRKNRQDQVRALNGRKAASGYLPHRKVFPDKSLPLTGAGSLPQGIGDTICAEILSNHFRCENRKCCRLSSVALSCDSATMKPASATLCSDGRGVSGCLQPGLRRPAQPWNASQATRFDRIRCWLKDCQVAYEVTNNNGDVMLFSGDSLKEFEAQLPSISE